MNFILVQVQMGSPVFELMHEIQPLPPRHGRKAEPMIQRSGCFLEYMVLDGDLS